MKKWNLRLLKKQMNISENKKIQLVQEMEHLKNMNAQKLKHKEKNLKKMLIMHNLKNNGNWQTLIIKHTDN